MAQDYLRKGRLLAVLPENNSINVYRRHLIQYVTDVIFDLFR
jgi:hypothetical protein